MSWEEKALGDVSLNIQTGPFGSQLHQADYSVEGIPVVMPKDLIDGRISEISIARVSEEHVKRLSRHIIKIGDILYSRRGDIDRCAFVSKKETGWLCGTGCLRVTLNPAVVDSKFIFYQLQQKSKVGWVEKHAVGATMLNLNTSILSAVPLNIPTLNIQHRIADILSTYDNLIENNQKQIKLLEEAARRLYKEWLVDLHFPGYEDTEIIDGVPEGWKKETVLECLQLYIGGGWGKESIVGKNTIPGRVIRGTDINDIKVGNCNNIPLRFHTENDRKKRTLKTNDIVFELSNGNINNIGRCLLIDDLVLKNCGDNTICASFCKLFRPLDKLHALILYCEIQDMQDSGRMLPYKKQGSNGINNFAFEYFLKHELIVPDTELLMSPIDTIMKKIGNIQSQFTILKEARDRLLPKLMSGELEV